MAKRERKGFKPTIAASEEPDKLEALALQLKEEKQQPPPAQQTAPPAPPVSTAPETVRITIDIPKPFHAELKHATKMMGQTLKGYLLYLARQDIQGRKDRGEL